MHSSLPDEVKIAQSELYQYLEQQVSAIAPELTPLVPVPIRVERVGFTRNASNTPYIVYWVGDRRCSTFMKRRWFLEMAQKLLKLKCGIEDKICRIVSSPDFGLWVKAGDRQQYLHSVYVRRFFERYNRIALERTEPVQCNCGDIYNMCLHQIVELFRPRQDRTIR